MTGAAVLESAVVVMVNESPVDVLEIARLDNVPILVIFVCAAVDKVPASSPLEP